MSTLHTNENLAAPHVIQLKKEDRVLGLREDGTVAPITYHLTPDVNMAYATQEQPIAKTITYEEYVNAPGETEYPVQVHTFFRLPIPELLLDAVSRMRVLTNDENGELINPFDPDLTDAEKEVVIERCRNDLAYFVEIVLEGRTNKEPIVMKLFNALLNNKLPESAGSGPGRGLVTPNMTCDVNEFEDDVPARGSHSTSIVDDTTDFDGVVINMQSLLGDEPFEKLSTKQPRETLGGISVRKKNTE